MPVFAHSFRKKRPKPSEPKPSEPIADEWNRLWTQKKNVLDFSRLDSDAERLALALANLHESRAEQYWSWFRICGVISTMCEQNPGEVLLGFLHGFLHHHSIGGR